MKKSFIKLVISIFAACSMISCAPTTEGETHAWERNQLKVKELLAEYPNFAQAIEKQAAEAATAMEAALKISEEEPKAEAMEVANEMISDSFIGKLGSVQRRLDNISDKQVKLKSMRMKREVVKRAEKALEASYRAVDNVEELLAEGTSSITEAESVAKDATSELISAEGKLSGAIKAAKKSMEEPKRTEKKKKS